MEKKVRKKIMYVMISALTIYLILMFFLLLIQRSIIYYPTKMDKRYEFPEYVQGMEEVFITCEDSITINGLFVPADRHKPCILIFHGNAGDISHRDILLQGFARVGCSVLLIDYHGYGKSEGTPCEQKLFLDGKASLEWLRNEKAILPENIVLFGKSLGSGVAVELAVNHTFKGIILETPFSSTASVARSHFPYWLFPVGLMIIDKFDNLSKITRINCPLLLVHGTRDMIVNKRESEKLYKKALEPKQLHLIKGAGHNDIQWVAGEEYWKKIGEWIQGL